MKIRYKNNGVTDNVERNLGTSLIRAGIAEELQPLVAPLHHEIKPVVFSVVLIGTPAYVAIRAERDGRFLADYYGSPDAVHNKKNHDGSPYSTAFGRAVPDEILADYKKQWKNKKLRAPLPAVPGISVGELQRQNADRDLIIRRQQEADEAAKTHSGY